MPPEPHSSPPSPHASLRPRPTIADISINPRRRLRDGSRSSVGSSSSGTSSATALSSGRGRRGTRTGSREVSQMPSRRNPGRTAVTRSAAAAREPRGASDTPIQISDSEEELDSSQNSIVAISPAVGRGRGRSVTTRTPRKANAGLDNGAASLNSSSSSTPNARPSSSSPESTYTRRFTAKEKGKGRAPPSVAIEISSDEDDGVVAVEPAEERVLMGVKTREIVEVEEPEIDEDSALGTGYSCPICFNPPSPAILTSCGHILCAGCLHSALTAAIRRNPNPQPDPWAARGMTAPRGGRGRGRGGATTRGKRGQTGPKEPQPTHWTPEGLKGTFVAYKKKKYDESLKEQGWSEDDRAAALACVMMEDGGGEDMNVEAKEVLAGLWSLGNKGWVVEGECPVCRNALPGGYGPFETGIGEITPLQARLSTAKA
ncbi:hypothetical protein IAR50_007113 [Cryptococcus sp. DSM 104548]